MGDNKEIRKRMETYRTILLVINWIGAIVILIAGIIMIGYETGGGYRGYSNPLRPYGIALLIFSILGGIIGHFLVNVGLAVPFILLNNGDILESMKNTQTIKENENNNEIKNSYGFDQKKCEQAYYAQYEDIIIEDKWKCGKCGNRNEIYLPKCSICGKEINS